MQSTLACESRINSRDRNLKRKQDDRINTMERCTSIIDDLSIFPDKLRAPRRMKGDKVIGYYRLAFEYERNRSVGSLYSLHLFNIFMIQGELYWTSSKKHM